jgi:hypothetical protein
MAVEAEVRQGAASLSAEASVRHDASSTWSYSAFAVGARYDVTLGSFVLSVGYEHGETTTTKPTRETESGQEDTGTVRIGGASGRPGEAGSWGLGGSGSRGSSVRLDNVRELQWDTSIGAYAYLSPVSDLMLAATARWISGASAEDPATQQSVLDLTAQLTWDVARADPLTFRFLARLAVTIPTGGGATSGASSWLGFQLLLR